MTANPIRRKLAAILAADAVGFSRLMGEDEERTMRVLSAHRAVIDGIIEFHGGRIVGTAGDSVLAEFGSPVEAVRCAVEIQDALKTRNNSLPEAQRLHFRIGINLGDVMIKGDDLLGDGVNVAARLEGIAEPGGICVSSSVYDQIAGKLDLGFVEMGEQSLKNIERPIRVYRVATGVAAPAPAVPPPRKARGAWVYAAGGAAVVLIGIVTVLRLREAPPVPAQPVTAAAPVPAPEVAAKHAQEAQRERETQIALEAQRRVEDGAKAEIAAVKARADADIAKARAESEVARARAETENVRRQAAAELAAARAKQAEMRPPAPSAVAPVVPAPAIPAEVPSAPPPAASTASSPAQPRANSSPFDGSWEGQSEVWHIKVIVENGGAKGIVRCFRLLRDQMWGAWGPTFDVVLPADGAVNTDLNMVRGWTQRRIAGSFPNLSVTAQGKVSCPDGQVSLRRT